MKTFKNEAAVKHEINRLLDKHKFFWWNTISTIYSSSGVSDKLAYRAGVLMAIEVKHKNKKPTVLQKAFLDSIRAEEGFAFVVSDLNIDWFQGFLEAFDRAAQAAAKNDLPTPEDGAYMINAINELTKDLS